MCGCRDKENSVRTSCCYIILPKGKELRMWKGAGSREATEGKHFLHFNDKSSVLRSGAWIKLSCLL